MSEKSAVYECVDREHDAWRCRACGYIEQFERKIRGDGR